jgi:hypothetical protein
MKPLMRIVLLTCLVALSAGQGLKRRSSLAASNEGAKALEQAYRQQFSAAQKLAAAYKSQSASQKASCSGKGKASICASNAGAGRSDDDASLIALGPVEFSWLNPAGGRGGDVLAAINPFGPVRDQGECATCVSFAVIAAAEAAVARTLGLGGGIVRMSIQDHGFCPVKEEDLRFCNTGWDLDSALNKVKNQMIVSEDCLRYQTSTLFDDEKKCAYSCTRGDAKATGGRFDIRALNTLAKAQRHIRRFGGVVTSMAIYSDFRPFFSGNPSGVYDGKGCNGGTFVEDHAAVLVGYNNQEGYLIARNSWGQGFADAGYFKIKYGVCGMASPREMWGISWIPNGGVKIPYDVSQDAQNPGCYIYRARGGDSISSLADVWGVDAFELLYNNSANIDDVSKPLAGTVLSVCDITSNSVDLKTPSWISQDTVTPEYRPSGSGRPSSKTGNKRHLHAATDSSSSSSDGVRNAAASLLGRFRRRSWI